MGTEETRDTRLEAIQEEIDAIRRRLPDNPGFEVPDPDERTLWSDEDDHDAWSDDGAAARAEGP